LPCSFYRSIYLSFFLILAVGDWMSTILPHMVWHCGFSANLQCLSEMCSTRLAANTGCKKIAILAPSHNFESGLASFRQHRFKPRFKPSWQKQVSTSVSATFGRNCFLTEFLSHFLSRNCCHTYSFTYLCVSMIYIL